jgi:protoporphyrinogen oxidase
LRAGEALWKLEIWKSILCLAASPAACNAAENLHYRDFLTVALILRDRQHFTDNWIYIHDPNVLVGRSKIWTGRNT